MFRDWKKSWVWWGNAILLPCVFLLLPWTVEAAAPPAATFQFRIPATTLDNALTRFTEQSGVSVGITGNLPRVTTRQLAGQYTAQAALRLLLADTQLEPLQISALAYRLQPRTAAPVTPATQPEPSLSELPEVMISAGKREQDIRTIPVSMAVIDGTGLAAAGAPGGSRAALLLDSGMSSTNLGPGRNRQYIRGVADSPFLGPSQATVSVQFDESRATYDGPDPDLRLFDIEQVEILKGPQGPLYGTGALGGVFRIVPRRPELDQFRLQSNVQVTNMAGGSTAAGADLMLNVPLVEGKVGLRAVAYGITEPGWIDNAGGRSDANDTRIRGGRLALHSALPSEWTLDMQGVAQVGTSRDSQYLTGASRSLRRSDILPEPHDNDFYLGSLTARGRLFGRNALLTASTISHEADGMLDASAAAAQWNVTAPLRYFDNRQYKLVNQELRFWSDSSARTSWLLGASHLSAYSDISGSLLPADADPVDVLQQAQHVQETALFGELGIALAAQWRTTLGLRVFRSTIESELSGSGADSASESDVTAATPSVALDFRSVDERQFVYLRYARAIRPGGLSPESLEESEESEDSEEARRFAADQLQNLDLGVRLRLFGDALSVQGAVFATRWSHIQSDYLLPNGLVGTRNVGNGRNFGVEAAAVWQASDHWSFEAGATLQHAHLHEPTIPITDSRLPIVPDVRLRAAILRSFGIASWQATVRAEVNHVGSARLSFEEALDRRTPAYETVDSRFTLRRAGLELTVYASNLLNSRADTFAFGNPFSVRSSSQHTPLQPRAVTIGVGYGW